MSLHFLSDKVSDSSLWGPREVLEDAISVCHKYKKALVVLLDDSDANYDRSWRQSGFKMSELIALCEILKSEFKSEMGI